MATKKRCLSFSDLSRKMEEEVRGIANSLKTLNGKKIAVGVPSDAKYPNGTKVAKVARLIEYGTHSMAPRPYLRQAFAANAEKWKAEIAEKCKEIAKGKGSNYRQALQAVGNEIVEEVRENITAMDAVDTGRLRDSFKAKVVG